MPESEVLGAIELPATFGKYFLTEKLATGGMAEIYLAKLVGPGGFEKQLVIKQIHPKLSGQRHFVDLFVAEAKTLVTLAHGNIVPVYELGVIDDTYFIAMEYIDGPTLYRLTETLRRREVAMDPAIAAWITARVVEGLDYAHRKGEGVIHRDLSPRNVMLSRDGEVKLVDFGIAVTLGAGGEDEAGQSAPTGSFPYMSPEQVRKEALTVQTDLFSVGVLLWEMLAGRRLFARDDPDATLHAVVDGEIARPSDAQPDVPARLDEVVMRALERDMTARWSSASDLLAALQRYLYSLDDPPGPRDVAALVARYCPPETRRLPTHHDELAYPDADPDREADPEAGHEATEPRIFATSPAVVAAARPGPATAVIPRVSAAPRGKRRTRARTETFATNVDLDELLVRVAPADELGRQDASDAGDPGAGDAARRVNGELHGHGELRGDGHGDPRRERRDDDARGAAGARPGSGVYPGGEPERAAPPRIRARTASTPPADTHRPYGPQSPIQLPGRVAPTAALLVFAGLGALGLAGGAVYVFYNGRAAVLRPDAPPRADAHVFYVEPDDAAGTSAPEAGAPLDAGPRDAGLALDAPPSSPRDAAPPTPPADGHPGPVPRDASVRVPPRLDARGPGELIAPIDAGAARGNAVLSVGANPWGNVRLDGKKIGRTPIEHLAVVAGHHTIEVVFAGEDPPRTLTYSVELGDGEAKDVLADFTKP